MTNCALYQEVHLKNPAGEHMYLCASQGHSKEEVTGRILNMRLPPEGHAKYIFHIGYAKKQNAIEGNVD